MKVYAISCLLLISIQATYSLPKPINNILLETIENIRRQMPCGIDGGPSLVPFREEFVDVSYDNSIVGITGFLQDIQVDNLNEFVVDNIDFSLLHLKLDFGFTLPNLAMKGLYNITGQYLNRIKLWGDGPFSVELNDLKLSGSLRLRIANGGFLDMTELQIVLSLNSLKSNISGILGSDETSFAFNMLIEDLIPQMLDTYSNDIGQMISKYVTPIANEYLHQLTLSDIIGGGNDNDPPCIVNKVM